MSFETPAALWGLLSLVLLVIFSLWRQAAVRTTVPSLLLWKKIPERNPPIRALRRPRWRLELLLQALAIAAAISALAGPFLTSNVPKPHKIAFVFDTSARMFSGDRIARMKRAASELAVRLPGDEVVVYAGSRKLSSIDEVQGVHAHVDVAPLLAAARQETEHVILFGDRAPSGVHAMLFGAEGGNIGIVEFSASDREVFARLVNHGPPRPATLQLTFEGYSSSFRVVLPSGVSTWSRPEDFSKSDEVRLKILEKDALDLDNIVRATRLAPSRSVVSVTGRHHPMVVRALESVPGVVVRRGAGDALVSVGIDEEPAKAPLRVWARSGQEFKPKSFTVAPHALTEEVRPQEVIATAAGELRLSGDVQPLFYADGKLVGALQEGTVRLSFEIDAAGWLGPSFPIFWQNVVDYARGLSGTFAVVRTGRPFELPSGVFLEHMIGEFEVKLPGGPRVIATNLLDARESDIAGETRALDWDPADPAGRVPRRRPLAGWFAALALLLVAAAWILQRRGGVN